MKVKTSELEGIALDWAVAVAEGLDYACEMPEVSGRLLYYAENGEAHRYNPSTSWAQGGPIIERVGVFLWRPYGVNGAWSAKLDGWPNERVIHADSPLIAAMRCAVQAKLGDEVEIPEELT